MPWKDMNRFLISIGAVWQVIDQVRGTNPKLERRFDQLYRKRP
jgi:hypothetical protein